MQFFNLALLFGLVGIAVPILIHLFNRRTRKRVKWGAMRFLQNSHARRNKRVRLEDALLLLLRCLMAGVLALALARPFVGPGWAGVAGVAVVWVLLLAIAASLLGALHDHAIWKRRLRWILLGLVLLAGPVLWLTHSMGWGQSRGGATDLVLLIDASDSMTTVNKKGRSAFAEAVDESLELIRRAPRSQGVSVVLVGSVIEALSELPTHDRDDLIEQVQRAQPVGGVARWPRALEVAVSHLRRGANQAGRMVVFSDGQAWGWELNQPDTWERVDSARREMPSPPPLWLREVAVDVGESARFAIVDMSWSREVVGTDRPVTLTVEVQNTGDQAGTPPQVAIQIGDREHVIDPGRLRPGASDVLYVDHRFSQAGAVAVSATFVAPDATPWDDAMETVAHIVSPVKVLLVDGNPSPKLLERASGYTAFALDPPENHRGRRPRSVETKVVEITDLPETLHPGVFDCVWLLDVPRLTGRARDQVERFLAAGGGVSVVMGRRSDPAFWSEWLTQHGPDEVHFVERTAEQAADAARVEVDSLTHQALATLRGKQSGDLANVALRRWWAIETGEVDATVATVGGGWTPAGRLSTGTAWMIGGVGAKGGRVWVYSHGLDLHDTNLPACAVFVPVLHASMEHLAAPVAITAANRPQAERLQLALPAPAGNGLVATYFKDSKLKEPVLSRLDSQVKFQWGTGSPAKGLPVDGFSARWEGTLRVPESGEYRLEGRADDVIRVWLDGAMVLSRDRRSEKVILEAGRPIAIKVEYEEFGANAAIDLVMGMERRPLKSIPAEWLLPRLEARQGETTLEKMAGTQGSEEVAALHRLGVNGEEVWVQPFSRSGVVTLPWARESRVRYPDWVDGDGALLFGSLRDAGESDEARLDEDARAFLTDRFGLAEPDSVEALIEALHGEPVGREWARPLLAALAVCLLLESLVGSWVTRRRRVAA